MTNAKPYYPRAFVSSSLREEDKRFVEFVCKILEHYGIQPMGTVGKFSASPDNPVELIKKNIHSADIIAVCATTRYLQQDVGTGKHSTGLSEMIHFEAGMATAYKKPVVVFVQEGVQMGSVIPNITQYITLDGTRDDFNRKEPLIASLLGETRRRVEQTHQNRSSKATRNFFTSGLAVIGALSLYDFFFGDGEQ